LADPLLLTKKYESLVTRVVDLLTRIEEDSGTLYRPVHRQTRKTALRTWKFEQMLLLLMMMLILAFGCQFVSPKDGEKLFPLLLLSATH
jgi:hypothetical protein